MPRRLRVDTASLRNAASPDTTTTSTSTVKTKNDAGAEDRFLKLLVAQMQNQDPLNPMDNAQVTSQMAQIQSVNGIEKLNRTVESLGSQFAQLSALLKPGGLHVCSTLNRNAKSYMMAIVGAEQVMRWLPKGTHDWAKFITPDELYALIRRAGLEPVDRKGMVFNKPDPASFRDTLSKAGFDTLVVTVDVPVAGARLPHLTYMVAFDDAALEAARPMPSVPYSSAVQGGIPDGCFQRSRSVVVPVRGDEEQPLGPGQTLCHRRSPSSDVRARPPPAAGGRG